MAPQSYGSREIRISDCAGFSAHVIEKGNSPLIQRKAGLHVAEVTCEYQVEGARTRNEVDWALGLRSAAREVGHEAALLVQQL